jgi:predicted DNA-binding protein YlxM (UPF0122 family)
MMKHKKRDRLTTPSKWIEGTDGPRQSDIDYKYYEFNGYDDWQWTSFADPNPNAEELLVTAGDCRQELLEELCKELPRVIDSCLTDTQKKHIYSYWFEKLTLHQVADKYNVTHTAIHKSIFGDNKNGRFWGGAIKKIKKYMVMDGECRQLLEKLRMV